MALLAFSVQRLGMDKNSTARLSGRGFPVLEIRKLFFLMANTTGFRIYFFGFRFIVAIEACVVAHHIKRWFTQFAMAFVATHFIIRDVEVVAEFQTIFFLVASGQKQYDRAHQNIFNYTVHFHSRTSNDVRTL